MITTTTSSMKKGSKSIYPYYLEIIVLHIIAILPTSSVRDFLLLLRVWLLCGTSSVGTELEH